MSPNEEPLIHVIDDDAAFRRSTVFLLESMGWQVAAHASAEDFLSAVAAPTQAACLVLDIRMPMMSGLELQQVLHQRGFEAPIVFITGHGDVELAVQAMKHGACDFLEKPFKDQALIDAVGRAVKLGCEARARSARCEEARLVLERLSPREREVARLVALGLPNKLVGRELDISEKTVHVHRHHVMEKTGVGSAAELARLMLRADPTGLD
ncbi:response regulator transcription factor [Thauera mechernichensis]|uniref:Response regulator transcription factor n=1 Tax=Thauera mechernichensis TaxID=82788 RepID=A0ABW3WAP9_9RHOO|nr:MULTISPECIES: response regulator [Thauera]ENO78258.1 transcriptional regulator fixJ [Thauera sp. 27]MDG3066272.1 response regulator [Thauera mechernichensis]